MQEDTKAKIEERGLMYRQLISSKAFQYLVDEVVANIEDATKTIMNDFTTNSFAGKGIVQGMRMVLDIPTFAVKELKQLEDSEASASTSPSL